MIANTAFVIDTLTTVMTQGACVVDKKKLVWALNAKQDRPAVWTRMLEVWEKDLDNDRKSLCGHEAGSAIILFMDIGGNAKITVSRCLDWE